MMTTAAPGSAILDPLDRQLVRALQLSPRAAFSLIAGTLGVSEQTIARRYRRLRRDGLLRVTGAVDPRALGETDWMLRVRCRPDGALAVAEALARREDVSWVTINAGGAEVQFALRSRTQQDRHELLVQRLPRSAPVLDLTASVILHRFLGSDPADWQGLRGSLTAEQAARLTPSSRGRNASGTGSSVGVRLAGSDHTLLDLLAADGRTTQAVLARATGMSVGRVARRIEALEASGVVYFDVDIAVAAMDNPLSASLWLAVAPAHLDAVGRAVAEHDEVQFAAAITGRHNFIAAVTCTDLDALYGYVTTKISKLAGIHDFELSPVLHRIKQAGAITAGDRLADPLPPKTRR